MTCTRSRRWFRVVVVAACVVLVGSGLWRMARPKLPSHKGKNVYDWMLQTRSSSLEDNVGLKAIGTNAVPFLAQIAILTNLLTEKQGKGLAAEYLGLMGPSAKSATPVLLEASQQDIGAWVDRYDRARCALAARQIAGPNEVAIKELEAALAFPQNPWVRGAVARDLGKQGKLAEPLLPALRRSLNDSDRDVRYEAQIALATIAKALE